MKFYCHYDLGVFWGRGEGNPATTRGPEEGKKNTGRRVSHGGEGCSRGARGRGVRPPPPRAPAGGGSRRTEAFLLLRGGPAPRAPAGGVGNGGRAPGDAAGGGGGPRAALLPLGLRLPPLPLGHQLLLLLARPPLPRRLLAPRLRPHPPLCCALRGRLHHLRGGSPHLGHDFHRGRRATVRPGVEGSRDVQRRGEARSHRIHGVDSAAHIASRKADMLCSDHLMSHW